SMIASWGITKHVRGYCMLFLLLETGMIGTFFALDFFLFYIFWEVMLLPMYFLIGVWGGPRREYAAIKFFLYTLLGSVFILIALLGFYFTKVRAFVDPRIVDKKVDAMVKLQNKSPQEAREQVVVNSFDLVVLQKAGQAAARLLHGEQPERVARELLMEGEKWRLSPEERSKLQSGTAEEKVAIVQRLNAKIDPEI